MGAARSTCASWWPGRSNRGIRRRQTPAVDLASRAAPLLSGKDDFGHMLFIKRERPEIYRNTFKFLDVLDYVNLRLTGRYRYHLRSGRRTLGHRQPRPRTHRLSRRSDLRLDH